MLAHMPAFPTPDLQAMESFLGQLTRLEVLPPPPRSEADRVWPVERHEPPLPWAHLQRLQVLVLQRYSWKDPDISGLRSISSTLARLELRLVMGKALQVMSSRGGSRVTLEVQATQGRVLC
jgi:hypothetical protein